MNCPQCGATADALAKFCNQCGTKLTAVCGQCGNVNPPGSKFCSDCGVPLGGTIAASAPGPKRGDPVSKLRANLPTGLAEKILAQRDRIEGERKQITVLFCDLAGFTPLTEQLGPEETYRLMDAIYELLIREVQRYEGTVNEMTGDGVLALFGAPIALEDAPQRAIRAALSIHREMARLNETFRTNGMECPPLRMRVGIHTGPVVVGTLGNDLRVEFKAVGDTVNLANRMQGLAEPGGTLITSSTYELVEGMFRCESAGKVEVKGKSEPVLAYRVHGTGKSRSRFDARAERGLTPFIGRTREVQVLRECYERARSGKGQAVSIVAEAGIGKSRLLHEFRKALAHEDVTFLEGRCASYGQNMPYLPVIDILRDTFSIGAEEGPAEIAAKIHAGLRQLGGSVEDSLPYLSELFSVEDGLDAIKNLDPEQKRRRTFDALRQIMLRGSLIRPQVIAFEDLHWVDKTSEESFKHFVEAIAGARVLLIFTYRSSYPAAWSGKTYFSQLTISRLSNAESLDMIRSLLDADAVDDTLAEFLLEKAEGVPFFVEEFTRSLVDSGSITRTDGRCGLKRDFVPTATPGTVHDVVMARVDRLPEGAREILQIASVIGREFSWPLIKAASGLADTELLGQISHLKEDELVYERGIFPQATYIFQHTITQDLVYDSLLAGRRKAHHLAVAHAIAGLYADRLDENASLLALHYTRGGDSGAAYRFHHLAGDRAAASYANREAMIHYQEAWRLLAAGGPGATTAQRRLDTATRLAEVFEPLGEFDATLTLLQEVLKHPEAREAAPYARIEYWMGNNYGNMGRYDEARTHLHRALELARRDEDIVTEGDAENYLCQLDYFQGYLARALHHGSEALRNQERRGYDKRLAWARVGRLMCWTELKAATEWDVETQEALRWCELAGNERARCMLANIQSNNLVKVGRYEAALEIAIEGLDRAERVGEGILRVFLLASAGYAASVGDQQDLGLRYAQKAESEGVRLGHGFALSNARLAYAQCLVKLNRSDEAAGLAKAALDFSEKLDLGLQLQTALEVNAEILSNRSPIDDAAVDQLMARAAAMVDRSESPWYRIQHHLAETRIAINRNRLDAAREDISAARRLYGAMGVEDGTGELRSLDDALSSLEGRKKENLP